MPSAGPQIWITSSLVSFSKSAPSGLKIKREIKVTQSNPKMSGTGGLWAPQLCWLPLLLLLLLLPEFTPFPNCFCLLLTTSPLHPQKDARKIFLPDWFCKSLFWYNPGAGVISSSRLSSASVTLDSGARITRRGEQNKHEAFLYTQCFPPHQHCSACFTVSGCCELLEEKPPRSPLSCQLGAR